VGDEYYNPVNNTLYKAVAFNGTTVQWESVLVSPNGVDYAFAGNSTIAGNTNITSTTPTTNTITGALVVSGGHAVGGNLYVGSRIGYVWTGNNVSSAYTIFNNTAVSIDTIFG